MAYDYSSENKRLELPNPYRLENFFLFACAAMLVAAGLTTLVWARTALQQAGVAQGAIPLVVGMGLLASALGFATAGARRLRFFFGRGRPASLAPEVAMGATGNSKQAETFKTMLRQGGLEYPEPQGALNGVLYHALPQLITAPLVVQRLAQKHFYNALAFLVTFLSFVCAWAFFGTPEAQPLISVGYFIFGAVMLVKPLVSGSQARVSTWSLVVLAAVAAGAKAAVAGHQPARANLLHAGCSTAGHCADLAGRAGPNGRAPGDRAQLRTTDAEHERPPKRPDH